MNDTQTITFGMFGEGIYGFFGEYRWLSNFEGSLINIEDKLWKSVEHYYQSKKSLDETIADEIRRADTPVQAKHLGKKIPKEHFDPNWDTNRDRVMYDALVKKFDIPYYEEKLISTKNLYLEETNHWNDTYWGVCKGEGTNKLGHMIMQIRKLKY